MAKYDTKNNRTAAGEVTDQSGRTLDQIRSSTDELYQKKRYFNNEYQRLIENWLMDNPLVSQEIHSNPHFGLLVNTELKKQAHIAAQLIVYCEKNIHEGEVIWTNGKRSVRIYTTQIHITPEALNDYRERSNLLEGWNKKTGTIKGFKRIKI